MAIHFGLLILREQIFEVLKNAGKTIAVLDKWKLDVAKLNMGSYMEIEHRPDICERALTEFYKEMNRSAKGLKL